MKILKQVKNDEETHPKCYSNILSFFLKFCSESSINGLKYISSTQLKTTERVVWTLVLFACMGYAANLMWGVLSKYFASPVIISFQPQETEIGEFPFPAITICNVNLLKADVLATHYENVKHLISQHGDEQNQEHPVNLTALPLDIHEMLIKFAIKLDRMTQFCLAAPSFRRTMKLGVEDAQGNSDFMEFLTYNLSSINDNFLGLVEVYEAKYHISDIVYSEAAMDCQDMILSCLWSGQQINCMEFFFTLDTRHGRCCVFNMMPNYILQNIPPKDHRAKMEREKLPPEAIDDWNTFASKRTQFESEFSFDLEGMNYPKTQESGGKPYGLSILLNPNIEDYSSCTVNDGYGFKIVAHSPVSSPTIMDIGAGIPINSEVFVDIEPHITIADENMLQGIAKDKRGCLLPTDQDSKLDHYIFYSTENCISECIAKETYKNCSCVTHFMPRHSNQTICPTKKNSCVHNVRENIENSDTFCSYCLPPCTEIKYQLQMSQFDVRSYDDISYYTYNSSENEMKNATNYTIVHLFYGVGTTYAKERKTLYDFSDLIANAGGLMELTMGISIISIFEIIYFFTVRLLIELCSACKRFSKSQSVMVKDIHTGEIYFFPFGKVVKSSKKMKQERFKQNGKVKLIRGSRPKYQNAVYPYLH